MKLFDIFLLGFTAIFASFLWFAGYPIEDDFFIVYLLVLGGTFVHFFLKISRLYNYTYSKATFLKASLHTDIYDVIGGIIWGLLIHLHFQMGFEYLFIWLFIGIVVILIGFFPNFLISEQIGIKLHKGNDWYRWEDMTVLVYNDYYLGYKTKEGDIKISLLLPYISKEKHRELQQKVKEIAATHQIIIKDSIADIQMVTFREDLKDDAFALDDFETENKNFFLLTTNEIVSGKKNKWIKKSDVKFVRDEEDKVMVYTIKASLGVVTFLAEDYSANDWQIIKDYFYFDA